MMHSLNSNIDIDGKRYHVQTEKLGWQIVTLVFEGGAVIARRKKDLSEVGAAQMSLNEFAIVMKEQHQEVITEIKASHSKPTSNGGEVDEAAIAAELGQSDSTVVGPSVLPDAPAGKKPRDERLSEDLISKFLEEWADDE